MEHGAQQRAGELAKIRESNATPMRRRQAELIWVRRHFARSLLDQEPSLLTSRWPGYWHLSSLEATERFAEDYTAVYRQFQPELGRDPALPRPLAPLFALNSTGTMTALWKARQIADGFGLPYREHLTWAIAIFVRLLKWNHVPRPSQLYSTKYADLINRIPEIALNRANLTTSLLKVSTNPRFLADNYQNLVDQNAVLDRIAKCVADSEDPATSLALFLSKPAMISPATASKTMARSLVDEALCRVGQTSAAPGNPVTLSYYPACSGLIHPIRPHANCKTCPWSGTCSEWAVDARKRLTAAGHGADPRREHEQKLSRARSQRLRERRKSDDE